MIHQDVFKGVISVSANDKERARGLDFIVSCRFRSPQLRIKWDMFGFLNWFMCTMNGRSDHWLHNYLFCTSGSGTNVIFVPTLAINMLIKHYPQNSFDYWSGDMD